MWRLDRNKGRAESLPSYLFMLIAISGLSMAVLSGGIVFRESGLSLTRPFKNNRTERHNEPTNARPAERRPGPPIPTVPKKDSQLLRELAEQLEKLDQRTMSTEYEVRIIQSKIEESKTGVDWIAVGTTIIGLIQGLFGLALAIHQWRQRKASQPAVLAT